MNHDKKTQGGASESFYEKSIATLWLALRFQLSFYNSNVPPGLEICVKKIRVIKKNQINPTWPKSPHYPSKLRASKF